MIYEQTLNALLNVEESRIVIKDIDSMDICIRREFGDNSYILDNDSLFKMRSIEYTKIDDFNNKILLELDREEDPIVEFPIYNNELFILEAIYSFTDEQIKEYEIGDKDEVYQIKDPVNMIDYCNYLSVFMYNSEDVTEYTSQYRIKIETVMNNSKIGYAYHIFIRPNDKFITPVEIINTKEFTDINICNMSALTMLDDIKKNNITDAMDNGVIRYDSKYYSVIYSNNDYLLIRDILDDEDIKILPIMILIPKAVSGDIKIFKNGCITVRGFSNHSYPLSNIKDIMDTVRDNKETDADKLELLNEFLDSEDTLLEFPTQQLLLTDGETVIEIDNEMLKEYRYMVSCLLFSDKEE